MLYIKETIKRHGYTQRRLAIEMGVNEMTVSNYINGNPTYNTMQKIADIIGADIVEFFMQDAEIKCPHCGMAFHIHSTQVPE